MKAANKPDPATILLDAIAAKLPTRAARRSIGINLNPEQNAVIQEAAAKRNISLSAYMRRAALAFAAFDLELGDDVFANEQLVLKFYTDNDRRQPADDLGPWRIEGLT